jgi:ketosteroid isomerase-like protein
MTMSEDINKRLQALEDRAEITQLVARYGPAVDDHAYDDLAALYTHDAIFDSVGGRIQGRDAVIDYYRGRGADFSATYHYPHSVEIHLEDANHARGVICAHAELSIDGDSHWVALRYHDTYRRDDGGWRFHERDVKLLYVLNAADLSTGLSEGDRVRWPGTDRAPATLGSDLD